MIEKIIHGIEFNNPYDISSKKTQKLLIRLKKKSRISRRVYQSLFVDVANSFMEYIHSLDVDEIQKLGDDLKANGWGTKSLLELKTSMKY